MLGLYLGGVVQALVKDFIMPLIGLAIPGASNLATLERKCYEPNFRRRRLPNRSDNVHNRCFRGLLNCEDWKTLAYRLKNIHLKPLFFLINKQHRLHY